MLGSGALAFLSELCTISLPTHNFCQTLVSEAHSDIETCPWSHASPPSPTDVSCSLCPASSVIPRSSTRRHKSIATQCLRDKALFCFFSRPCLRSVASYRGLLCLPDAMLAILRNLTCVPSGSLSMLFQQAPNTCSCDL